MAQWIKVLVIQA
jgi:hypothetical protein